MSDTKDKLQAKFIRRGDGITLGEPCANTASVVKHLWSLIEWPAREMNQWSEQMREMGKPATFEIAKQNFADSILVKDENIVTRAEMQEQLDKPVAPAEFTKKIIARHLGLSETSVKTLRYRKSHP